MLDGPVARGDDVSQSGWLLRPTYTTSAQGSLMRGCAIGNPPVEESSQRLRREPRCMGFHRTAGIVT